MRKYVLYLRDKYIDHIMLLTAERGSRERYYQIDLGNVYSFLAFAGWGNRCLYCGRETNNRINGLPFCNEEHYKRMKEGLNWYYVRKKYLESHPICEICGVNKATEVHHIIEVSEGGDMFDENNLIAVCKECHKKLHNRSVGELYD